MKDHMARKAIDELADQLGYKKMNYYESIESVDTVSYTHLTLPTKRIV